MNTPRVRLSPGFGCYPSAAFMTFKNVGSLLQGTTQSPFKPTTLYLVGTRDTWRVSIRFGLYSLEVNEELGFPVRVVHGMQFEEYPLVRTGELVSLAFFDRHHAPIDGARLRKTDALFIGRAIR